MGDRRRRAGAALLVGAVAVVACGDAEQDGAQRFEPVRPGVLTVATALPAPGFWTDASGRTVTDPADLAGGLEWAIARSLAERFGLRLDVVDVPLDRLLAGDLGGADLALAQVTATDERGERVDFSVPYLVVDAGVVAASGEEIEDLKTARERTWAAVAGTTDADLLDDVVRPDDAPVLVDDERQAVEAVASGRVGAAVMDLPTALLLVAARTSAGDAAVDVVARFVTEEPIAVVLSDGAGDTANGRVVDAAVRALVSGGEVDDLADEWLHPALGRDPDDLPAIRTR